MDQPICTLLYQAGVMVHIGTVTVTVQLVLSGTVYSEREWDRG